MYPKRTIMNYRLFALALALPIVACTAGTADYRFPREPGTTPGGYPLPLSGKPITKTPVVSKEWAAVKEYTEH